MVPRLLILALAAASLESQAGRALFDRAWVQPSTSVRTAGGLGPLYDASACGQCHAGGGPGPAAAPGAGEALIVRLGDARGAPDPVYGAQLQRRAVPGVAPEARVALAAAPAGRFDVGVSDLAYGALAPSTRLSLRRAPSLFGIGQLAAAPDSEILERAAEEKATGVGGRPAWLAGPGGPKLGRWGWKASQAGLADQIAAAMQRDLGVSTVERPGAWGECAEREAACRLAAGAGTIEASPLQERLVLAYLGALVREPSGARTEPDAFRTAGCADCHAILKAADGQPVAAYTDLLLHDMGPGLDDGAGEGAARPDEWRTAPLWNIRAELAAGGLLHDGRARSIAEAVRWHGGQAASSRARYFALPAAGQAAITDFLLQQ